MRDCKKIKLWSTLLILALSLISGCLAGCGKAEDKDKGNVVQTAEGEAVVYVPSYSNLTQITEYNEDRSGTVFSELNTFGYNFIRNNKLYSVSQIYTTQAGNQDYLAVYDMTAGQNLVDERKLGSVSSYFEYNGGFIRYFDKTLEIYDYAFEKIKEVDLKNAYDFLRESGRGLSCDDIVIDGEGRIGIANGDMLLLLDGDGNLLHSMECPLGIMAFEHIVVTRSGEWYVFCENSAFYMEGYCVDVEKGVVMDSLEGIPSIIHGSIFGTGEYGENNFYIFTRNYIYEYDTEASECRELFGLRDYGITVDDDSAQGILDGGEFYILNEQDSIMKEADWLTNFELATVKAVPEDEVHPRKELVMAEISELYYFYRDPIMKFNKYNSDYYITLKSYDEEDEDEGYASVVQRFYNDLITGKGADIFWVDNSRIDIENLGEKDVAVDLYELIDADEEISREDFIPNILSEMDYDGKLYAVSPNFYLHTLVGKASAVGQYDKWDFDALYDLMMRYPDAVLISPATQAWTLDDFLKYSMDMFYDEKNGECNFASEQFSKMLEIVAAQPTKTSYEVPMQKRIKNDEVILYRADYISSCSDIKWIDKYFEGNEIEYAGFPSNEQSCAVVCFNYSLVINSQSENQEGAWEFVKSYFTYDNQMSLIYFPVIQSCFDSLLEQEKAECRYGRLSDVYGTVIKGEALTEEQAQTLCYLVNSATATNGYDTEIYNIIYEEVQGYLAGQRSAGEVAAIIQNRVQLYLDEQN